MRNTRIVLAKRARTVGQISIAVSAMLITLVTTVQPGQAAPLGPSCVADPRPAGGADDFAETLNLAVAQMRIDGLTQKEIDRRLLRDFRVTAMTRNSEMPTTAETEDVSVQAVSTGNDVSVGRPSIYREGCTGKWYAIASYKWLTMSRFRSEWPLVCGDPCALSGADGFGISFSRDIAVRGNSSMTTWGKTSTFPPRGDRTWLDTVSNAGYWYEGVDHFKGSGFEDYDFYNGQIVVHIANPGCGPLQAVAKYSHTWSNVSINGVGLGHLAISLTWTSSNNRWGRSGDTSSAVYFC